MAKTRIRYDAQPGHVLVIDAKTKVEGGKEVDVDEKVAAELLLCSYADITIVGGTNPGPQWPGTHADLDALAGKLGVGFPQPAEGKSKLGIAEKVATLESAGFTPESALEHVTAAGDPPNDEGDAE